MTAMTPSPLAPFHPVTLPNETPLPAGREDSGDDAVILFSAAIEGAGLVTVGVAARSQEKSMLLPSALAPPYFHAGRRAAVCRT